MTTKLPATVKAYKAFWKHIPRSLNALAKYVNGVDTMCPRGGNGKGKPIVDPVAVKYKGYNNL
jgi:hypothetical protein